MVKQIVKKFVKDIHQKIRQPLKNRGFQGHVHDVPLSSHFARSTVAKWCKELLKSGQNPSPHLIL